MKDLQIKPKKVLCVGMVRQTQRAWFIRTNGPILLSNASDACLVAHCGEFFSSQ